jgi:hypothetical protein
MSYYRQLLISETSLLALTTAAEHFLDTTRKLGIDTSLQTEMILAVTEANALLGLRNLHPQPRAQASA